MGEEPRQQSEADLLPERGGPSTCDLCGLAFQTRFALRKHEVQGCPKAKAEPGPTGN